MANFRHGGAVARGAFTAAEPAFRELVASPALQREHGGNLSDWARETCLDPGEIIDLSASINPLGPPPKARRAYLTSFDTVSRYPDVEGRALRTALARHHRVKTDSVLLGNGSTQLIYLLCRALRPREALVVQPAFSEYGNALHLCGTEIRSYVLLPQHEFRLPLDDFLEKLGRGLEMIFLSNPNSVTGQLIPRKDVEKIVRACSERKTFLVVDEAFMDFIKEGSVKQLIDEHPYLIVLRSLTKYYSLPGLRIGYLLAQRRIVDLLGLHQEPWSVNGPVQRIALACLGEARFKLKTSAWLARERAFLFDALAKMKGVAVFSSQANFFLVRLENAAADAAELRRYLLGCGLLIRCCRSFAPLGANYFRVAVHLRKPNRHFIQGLRAYLASAQAAPRPESFNGD